MNRRAKLLHRAIRRLEKARRRDSELARILPGWKPLERGEEPIAFSFGFFGMLHQSPMPRGKS